MRDLPHVQGYASLENEIDDLIETIHNELNRRFDLFEYTAYSKYICDSSIINKEMPLPRIVVLIDDANLIGKYTRPRKTRYEVERITDEGRRCGIHLVLAASHIRRKDLDWCITTNLVGRICLAVDTWRESDEVLCHRGAERLCYAGDAILDGNQIKCAMWDNDLIAQVANKNNK